MINGYSVKLRHSFVKALAPKLYSEWFNSHFAIRPMVSFLKKNKYPMVGVEIGVLGGHHAKSILDNLDIKKLYLVDPYLPYVTSWGVYFDPTGIKQKAKELLSEYANVEWLYSQSQEAVKEIPFDLDFVYIDGDHTYEAVKRDIQLYYPHVKKCGVLGGHDFSANEIGVTNAVMEAKKLFNTYLQGDLSDWWMVKP